MTLTSSWWLMHLCEIVICVMIDHSIASKAIRYDIARFSLDKYSHLTPIRYVFRIVFAQQSGTHALRIATCHFCSRSVTSTKCHARYLKAVSSCFRQNINSCILCCKFCPVSYFLMKFDAKPQLTNAFEASRCAVRLMSKHLETLATWLSGMGPTMEGELEICLRDIFWVDDDIYDDCS